MSASAWSDFKIAKSVLEEWCLILAEKYPEMNWHGSVTDPNGRDHYVSNLTAIASRAAEVEQGIRIKDGQIPGDGLSVQS